MSEHCLYRGLSKAQNVSVSFTNQTPLESVPTKECQALVEQKIQDAFCYNPELSENTCPLSPLYRKKY